MKFLRYLIAAMLVIGITGVANAFTFSVLDPTGLQKNAPIIMDTGIPIDFSFYACPASIDPSGTDKTLGCFEAVNGTSGPITSFSATITATKDLPAVDCSTDGAYGLSGAFTESSCSVSGDTLTVDFTGGDVLPNSTIVIVEDGVKDSEFKKDAGTFTVNSTPEPGTIWMALTGIGPLGYLVRRRRKTSQS
jgi:hypothetical protein